MSSLVVKPAMEECIYKMSEGYLLSAAESQMIYATLCSYFDEHSSTRFEDINQDLTRGALQKLEDNDLLTVKESIDVSKLLKKVG